jgi:hypothetical protein
MNDLAEIYEVRKTSFGPEFWERYIADECHYSLVVRVKSPLDFRLLYDSWLWRLVLDGLAKPTLQSTIIELLPGSSLTIPVALESVGYRGKLQQMNDELPVTIPDWFHFRHAWLGGKLVDLVSQPAEAGVILGNHIVDDLLFDIYCVGREDKGPCYSDVALCKAIWASLGESRALSSLQEAVTGLFMRLVQSMSYPSMLILRHYPSTFALSSKDLVRANAEMGAFRAMARTLRALRREVYYLDLSRLNVPAGSLYPASFLIVETRL